MNPSTLIGMVASVALMAVILLFGSDKPGNFIDAQSPFTNSIVSPRAFAPGMPFVSLPDMISSDIWTEWT